MAHLFVVATRLGSQVGIFRISGRLYLGLGSLVFGFCLLLLSRSEIDHLQWRLKVRPVHV
jgi:hypothetical protein